MTDANATNDPASADAQPLDDETLKLASDLFDYARAGDAERLAAYVDAGVPVDLRDASGNTLLMLAAYWGHLEATKALIARGADVDLLNDRGQSPLAGAVFKGTRDIALALLEAGADPDAGTPSARAAARMFGQSDLFA